MLKVLVVDDEQMIRLSFQKLINWGKYNLELVNTCCNGEEALDYIINNNVDILLTDINMPNMNGISLLKELHIRNITPTASIVLSAFDEYEYVRDSFKLNVDDYILKSDYDEDDVVKIILKIIESKCPNKENNATDTTIKTSSEISMVLEYINKNYHKDINLKTISGHVNYSEAYLSHLFSKEMGVPIMEYTNKLRVHRSKELLDTTNLKVYEIATNVGFNSVEHFSRSFKKFIGISPKQYKKNA